MIDKILCWGLVVFLGVIFIGALISISCFYHQALFFPGKEKTRKELLKASFIFAFFFGGFIIWLIFSLLRNGVQ